MSQIDSSSHHSKGLSHALSTHLPYLKRTLRLVWQACPGYTTSWVLLIIVQGILPVLTVQFTKWTVDQAIAYVEADDPDPVSLVVPLVLLAGVMVVTQILSQVIGWINNVQTESIQDYIKTLIHDKVISLDLSYFEITASYDMLHRAYFDAHSRPGQLLQSSGALFQSTLTLIGMAALLVSYSVWLVPFLILTTVPAAWVVVRYAKQYNTWRLANTEKQRMAAYYGYLLTQRDAAAEMRLFDLGKHYRDAFEQLRKKLRDEHIVIERNKLLTNLWALLISLLGTGAVMAWMGRRVIRGSATFGDFAAFYQIFSRSQGLAKSFINHTGNILQSMLFIENLFEFLDLQPRLVDDPAQPMIDLPLKKGIHFNHVTFRYPGSKRAALKAFDWVIPAGKIVALVGENGEGKSTLMKLLCRFYDPDDGQVLWDGVDLRDLPLDSIWRAVTVLFQVPLHYEESARRNISVGASDKVLTDEAIRESAVTAGADAFIQRLPETYDTVLGKWFGGEELSGGEWQRLALARTFVRQGSIIVLDEPTSSMDSWSELDWLHRLRQAVQDRTAILITHRFTTAMQADIIYVMKDNQIIEHGTHDELLAQGGHYATSWKQQVQEDQIYAQGLKALGVD